MRQTSIRERRPVPVPARLVGLLLGLSAATPAVMPLSAALPIRPWHAFALAALAVASLYKLRTDRDALFRLTALDLAVIAFTGLTLFAEMLNTGSLNYRLDYMSLARPLFWLAIFRSVRLVVATKEEARRLLVWFAMPVLPSALIGFGQVLGVDALQQAVIRMTSDSGGFATRLEDGRLLRATGLVQHWTSFGSYLCTVAAAGVALLALARAQGIGRQAPAWCLLAMSGLGVITTFTLSSILTALAIFVFCARAAKATSRILPLLLAIALVASAAVGPMLAVRIEQQFANTSSDTGIVPSTLQYRYRIWTTETIPMIAERPLTGWGSNVYDVALGRAEARRVYPSQLMWHSPESQWLNLLMNHGAVGLAAFIVVLGLVMRLLAKVGRMGHVWIARPTGILFALMVLAAFTAPVFMNHGLPVGLWTLVGLLSVFARQRAGASAQVPAALGAVR